jgi:hypothetical protein
VDGENRALVGTFAGVPDGSVVEPWSERGMVYFVSGQNRQWSLRPFRMTTFAPLTPTPIPRVLGSVKNLVKWGDGGMAGRAAVLHLLPFSLAEHPKVSVLRGGFPESLARPSTSTLWFGSYVQTYLERDVRQVTDDRRPAGRTRGWRAGPARGPRSAHFVKRSWPRRSLPWRPANDPRSDWWAFSPPADRRSAAAAQRIA